MMWEPRYKVDKSPGVEGAPVGYDEPCLVIRAQDVLAPEMLAHYMSVYSERHDADPEVIRELALHWVELLAWQRRNRMQLKTADR